jgi:benzoate/toluate 1,2-dioxygenase reductase subunit
MAASRTTPCGSGQQSMVISRRGLDRDTFELTLHLPPGFTFTAGQHIRVHLGDQARDYSLIPAGDPMQASILVRRIAEGRVSCWLDQAAPGTHLTTSGPRGRFIFQSGSQPAVFVATGTGIAPFVAMARAGITGFVLLHGVRSAPALFYREEMQRKAARYVPCLSGQASGGTGIFTGRVTTYLSETLTPGCYDFYLAGRQAMIAEAVALVDAKFPKSRVFTEIFF